MNRTQFIKTLSLSAAGILATPQLSFALTQEEFSTTALTGKGNSRLKGTDYKLIDTAYDTFQKMKNEALKSGIQLEVVSAYRSFNRQKEIWNRKYSTFTSQGLSPIGAINKIIEYSTIPGTSRHHWGTDIDLIDSAVQRPNNVLLEKHYIDEGVFCRMKEWMDQNASKFDFYEVYTNTPGRKGFKYEPWHFSYAPLSKPMLKTYLNIDILALIKNLNIQGSTHFSNQFIEDYIKNHILDIHPILLP